MDMIIPIIFGILIFSALFSGAETSFFSLAKIHIKKLEKENSKASKRILSLLNKPKQLLITVLLGSTLCDITATSLATIYVLNLDLSPPYNSIAMLLLVVIMTVLLLFFGEVIPKLYAFSTPIKFAGFTSYLIIVFKFILYPIILMLEWFTSKISKKKDAHEEVNLSFSPEDIRNIVKSDGANHLLEENEKKIFDSIFRFPQTEVKEIFIPRVDITGVEQNTNVEDVKQIIIDSGYSRIPVYNKTIDEIVGIVYAKDLILYPEKNTLQALQRKVFFVPENMKIETLLNQFQNKKKQIAIVVDEYGGTAGLVTLEDILEELVGEIMDEYDDEQNKITKLTDNIYLLSAMIKVSELNQEFNLNLPEDFDNLAEMLYSELNHIPKKNEKYTYKNSVEFFITHLKKQRINHVKMRILDNPKEQTRL